MEDIQHRGWRCGTPLGVESPGLMTGLAGIGYGLRYGLALLRAPGMAGLLAQILAVSLLLQMIGLVLPLIAGCPRAVANAKH